MPDYPEDYPQTDAQGRLAPTRALANLRLADQTLRKTHYFVGVSLCYTERLPFYERAHFPFGVLCRWHLALATCTDAATIVSRPTANLPPRGTLTPPRSETRATRGSQHCGRRGPSWHQARVLCRARHVRFRFKNPRLRASCSCYCPEFLSYQGEQRQSAAAHEDAAGQVLVGTIPYGKGGGRGWRAGLWGP